MTEAAMKNRIVVCSKTDLRVKKAVDRQSAKDFCRRVGCSYIEQCSSSGEGRDKLLEVPHTCAAASALAVHTVTPTLNTLSSRHSLHTSLSLSMIPFLHSNAHAAADRLAWSRNGKRIAPLPHIHGMLCIHR